MSPGRPLRVDMVTGMDPPRLCVRPMCAATAVASLHYRYAERTVWLEDPGPGPMVPGAWPLCATHADRLTVPDGWTLVDDRRWEPLGATG